MCMQARHISTICKQSNFIILYSKKMNMASTSREVQKDRNVCSSDMNENSD